MAVRRAKRFPPWCARCGCELPQWDVDEDSLFRRLIWSAAPERFRFAREAIVLCHQAHSLDDPRLVARNESGHLSDLPETHRSTAVTGWRFHANGGALHRTPEAGARRFRAIVSERT